MNEFLSYAIQIEGTIIHQTPLERFNERRLRRQAEKSASMFKHQFDFKDRAQSRGYFGFTSFVERIIDGLQVESQLAALTAWAVYQGHDSYSIRKGKIYIPTETGDQELNPITDGLPLSNNTDLFGASQVHQNIVGLQGNNQNRVYQVELVGKDITLQRFYQVALE